MEVLDCLMSLDCTNVYYHAYMVYLGIGTLITTIIGGITMFVLKIIQLNHDKSKNFRRKIEKAKKPSVSFKKRVGNNKNLSKSYD